MELSALLEKLSASDWITSVLALATVLMAGATVSMARGTKRLAQDTVDAAKQADRHHQENARPFCVLEITGATDRQPFGPEFDTLSSGPPPITLRVRGDLHNKGKGPAKDVLVYFNARHGTGEEGAYRLTRPVVVSGLIGPGDTIAVDVGVTERDVMTTWDGTRWQPTQIISAIAGDTYEIVLEYKDVFDNTFRTAHPRGIFENALIPDMASAETRATLMIRQDRPTPVFLTGKQTVRTLADLPPMPIIPSVSDEE